MRRSARAILGLEPLPPPLPISWIPLSSTNISASTPGPELCPSTTVPLCRSLSRPRDVSRQRVEWTIDHWFPMVEWLRSTNTHTSPRYRLLLSEQKHETQQEQKTTSPHDNDDTNLPSASSSYEFELRIENSYEGVTLSVYFFPPVATDHTTTVPTSDSDSKHFPRVFVQGRVDTYSPFGTMTSSDLKSFQRDLEFDNTDQSAPVYTDMGTIVSYEQHLKQPSQYITIQLYIETTMNEVPHIDMVYDSEPTPQPHPDAHAWYTILQQGKHCDISLHILNPGPVPSSTGVASTHTTIRAHCAMLSHASSALQVMCEAATNDHKTNPNDEPYIEFTDAQIDHNTMMHLIRFIYVQELRITSQAIIQRLSPTTMPEPPNITTAIMDFGLLPSIVSLAELSSLTYVAFKYDVKDLLPRLATVFAQLLIATTTSSSEAKQTILNVIRKVQQCPHFAKLLVGHNIPLPAP